jgi:hypothetical protein
MIPAHQCVAMDDGILEQLFRDDANFATAGGHRIVEKDTFVVHLPFSWSNRSTNMR